MKGFQEEISRLSSELESRKQQQSLIAEIPALQEREFNIFQKMEEG